MVHGSYSLNRCIKIQFPTCISFTFPATALEGDLALSAAEELYRVDVRDLLVNAEFAIDARAHERWCDARLAPS